MSLTKDEILKIDDVEIRQVSAWGGHVHIRSITAKERDDFEASVNDGENRNLANMRARLVVKCLCDDAGNLLFDNEIAGAADLGKKSGLVLDRLFEVATALNGMSKKDVEELAGNSEGGKAADSPSS